MKTMSSMSKREFYKGLLAEAMVIDLGDLADYNDAELDEIADNIGRMADALIREDIKRTKDKYGLNNAAPAVESEEV